MTVQKTIGVIVGFMGLLVLALPNLISGMDSTLGGILAVSIGSASYGVGIVYSRKHLRNEKPLHAPSGQLLSASIYLVLLALIFDSPSSLINISWEVAGAILILSIFGTAIAFVLYFKVLERTSASFLSLVNYLMPVFGIILGVIFMNESVSFEMFSGLALIFTGIAIVNLRINRSLIFQQKQTTLSCDNSLLSAPPALDLSILSEEK